MPDQTLLDLFDELWTLLRIQQHIVQHLSRSRNSKQALELAQIFYKDTRLEIIADVDEWVRWRRHFHPNTDANIRNELLHRINGEIAKLGVPILSSV